MTQFLETFQKSLSRKFTKILTSNLKVKMVNGKSKGSFSIHYLMKLLMEYNLKVQFERVVRTSFKTETYYFVQNHN